MVFGRFCFLLSILTDRLSRPWGGLLPVGRGAGGAVRGTAILHNVNHLAYCKTSFRRERCPQRSAARSAVFPAFPRGKVAERSEVG